MVSDFFPDRSAGAAGTILATGEALERAGHGVDYVWHDLTPHKIPHDTLSRWLELPRRQYRQVATRLSRSTPDVVIVSQPSAYLVYERLTPRYRNTLFLNRTHGWEARLYEAQLLHRWGRTATWRGALATRAGQAFARRACGRTARSCHGIVAASSACADFIRARYDFQPRMVATIAHGVDSDLIDQPASQRSGPPRMLFVGNYLPLKGREVLRAVLPPLARRYTGAEAVFVVDEGSVGRVRGDLGPHFGPRLHVQSWVSRSDLRDIYDAADILLFPSLFEGFGKVWLEAMARRLCVVGFSEGGLPDLARDGVTAHLAPTGDVERFADALGRALNDPDTTRRMGGQARAAVAGHTWDRTAGELVEFVGRLRAGR